MAWIFGYFKCTDEDVENLQRFEDNLKSMKDDIKSLLDNQNVPSKSAMYYVESENGKRKGSETIVCDNDDSMLSQMQHEPEKMFVDKSDINHLNELVNEMIEDVANAKDRLKPIFTFPLPRRHPSKKIQIFIPKRTKMTESFPFEAESLFQGISLKKKICHQYSTLSEESNLVVVCPVMSRIEVDVDSALEQINYNKPFVVLLLHPGIISSMPHVPTSSKLDKEKYQNIEFIDIAYSTENKLHDCEMNLKANERLKKYVGNSSSYCNIL